MISEKITEKPRNVWPRIPWKTAKAEVGDIGMEWMELLSLPIGWLYFGIHILAYVIFASRIKIVGVAILICLLISASTLTILRWNFKRVSERAEDSLSLAMLVRFYSVAAVSLRTFYSLGQISHHTSIYFWIVSGIFGVYFVFRTGTIREKFLKFFFVWPLKLCDECNETLENDPLDRADQMIWIVRFIFTIMAIGGSMMMWAKTLDQNLVTSLGAGLHEEAFKLLLTGTISMVPKYSRSRLAILYVAFAVGMGFAMAEDVGYFMKYPDGAVFIRFITPFAHSFFNFFIALAIARQRDGFFWWIELIFGFVFAMGSHAMFNFIFGSGIFTPEFEAMFLLFIIPFLTCGTFGFLLAIRSVYPISLKNGSRNIAQTKTNHQFAFDKSETP